MINVVGHMVSAMMLAVVAGYALPPGQQASNSLTKRTSLPPGHPLIRFRDRADCLRVCRSEWGESSMWDLDQLCDHQCPSQGEYDAYKLEKEKSTLNPAVEGEPTDPSSPVVRDDGDDGNQDITGQKLSFDVGKVLRNAPGFLQQKIKQVPSYFKPSNFVPPKLFPSTAAVGGLRTPVVY